MDGFECDTSSRDFFEFVGRSYKSFLAGDDGECFALEDELRSNFEERDRGVAEEVERSEAEIEGLRSSISGLTQRPTPLEALQQKKADLESDINKFESLIEKLREHKEAVERKSSEKHDDLQRAAEDLRRVEEENKDLEEVVSNQSINKEDVTRMAQQRSKLKDILHSLTSQKDSLLDAALEDEAKFEKRVRRSRARPGSTTPQRTGCSSSRPPRSTPRAWTLRSASSPTPRTARRRAWRPLRRRARPS